MGWPRPDMRRRQRRGAKLREEAHRPSFHPKSHKGMAAAVFRTILAQPTPSPARSKISRPKSACGSPAPSPASTRHSRRRPARSGQDFGTDSRRPSFPQRRAFAAHVGAAPDPASSGNTQRHRLARGGNRQLNEPCSPSPWSKLAGIPKRAHTLQANAATARPQPKRDDASSATSPPSSTAPCSKTSNSPANLSRATPNPSQLDESGAPTSPPSSASSVPVGRRTRRMASLRPPLPLEASVAKLNPAGDTSFACSARSFRADQVSCSSGGQPIVDELVDGLVELAPGGGHWAAFGKFAG